MEATPARSNAPGATDGKEGQTLAGKKTSAADTAQDGVRKGTDAQEDWASLATTDPAFWLKGLGH